MTRRDPGHEGAVLAIVYAADDDWIHCLALSPDGTTIASGGVTGAVRLWNAADGTRRAKW